MRRVSCYEPTKLNLGCGDEKKNGYVGLDRIDHGQEILWDATQGIPLPDNSVTDIYSSHFIEHVSDNDMSTVVSEIERICRDGASVEMRCPHADTIEANYPCHVSRWNEQRMRGLGVAFIVKELYRDGIELIGKFTIKKTYES